MRPSIATEFFNNLVGAPDHVAAIRGLVNSNPPTYEGDWFDCKLEPDEKRDPKQRDRKLKEMWLQALSGFANNAGGVLVWGLDARKDSKTGIDMVNGEKPVSEPFGLKPKLNEWRRQGTDPPLGNVQVEPFEYPPGSGTEFVVCLIPEGPFKPYRTNEGERSQYYLRASDSVVVMNSSVLRAMFYPRSQALLQVHGQFWWVQPDEGVSPHRPETILTWTLSVSNRGTATAKDVLLRYDIRIKGEVLATEVEPSWTRDGWYLRASN